MEEKSIKLYKYCYYYYNIRMQRYLYFRGTSRKFFVMDSFQFPGGNAPVHYNYISRDVGMCNVRVPPIYKSVFRNDAY